LSFFTARGLTKPNVLLIFREPVSHAISAYSHRAGRKHAEEFVPWLRNSYEFPHELPQFLEMQAVEQGMDLTLRPYSHQGLDDVLQDWLGSVDLPEPVPEVVNVSPSLTEAEFLVRLHRADAGMAERLRRAFKRIQKADKAQDTTLRQSYVNLARGELFGLNPHLEQLSALVGADLTVPPPGPASDLDGQTVLSPKQIEAIVSTCTQRDSLLGRRINGALRRLGLRVSSR
jgi:hypothetical protein